MAIRKVIIRPPTGGYADSLYPKTSADIVVSTDGNVQTDIDTLKSGKAATTHTHVKANITDFAHTHVKADVTDFPTLGTAASANTGTSSGNVPVLDGSGKLSTAILPAIAISDTFVVASEAAMLALTAEVGDVAVRTDISKSFILKTAGATVLANWQELLAPANAVQSVNGQTGIVSLTAANVGAAATVHTHTVSQITDFPVYITIGTVQPSDGSLWYQEIV